MLSLQLFTVRDLMKDDPLGTLEKVAALGYQGVETGALNLSPQFVDKLRQLNLAVTGTHVGLDALRERLDDVIEGNKTLGSQFVILSSVAPEWRGSAAQWAATARLLEEIGQRLHEAGMTLCYHNHAFEFEERYDSAYGLDILYANANPAYLQAELDVYWIQKGGAVPAAYLRKYAGRTPLVHLKDMDRDGNFTEVGEGVLDWPAIFSACQAGAVVHYCVEQDICPGNPLDSAAKSIQNLRGLCPGVF